MELYEYAAFLNGRLMFSEPEVEGTRPATGSLFRLEGDAIVSAVKAADDPDRPGIVVRVFNGRSEGDATATLVFSRPVRRAWLCDLRERKSGEVWFEGGTVELEPLGHAKFATVYVEL